MGKTGVGCSALKNSVTMAVDNKHITQKKRLYLRKKGHITIAGKGTQSHELNQTNSPYQMRKNELKRLHLNRKK